MYSRTQTFLSQFLTAFGAADLVIIVDIFPARERDTGLVHARDIVDGLARQPTFAQEKSQVLYGGSISDATDLLANVLRSGDLAIIMGAGDNYVITETLLKKAKQV
jgi:UDP-N-acetylmuramate--alanine ligase